MKTILQLEYSNDMKLRRRCKFHCAATALIFLLGAVRGIGGIIDLINNTGKLIEINTSSATLVLLTIFLILLSAASFITALSVYEQNKNSLYFGIIISTVFIFNSVLYGYILSEQTTVGAVIITAITAVAIITLLMLGRRSLNNIKESESETAIKLNKHPEHSLSH